MQETVVRIEEKGEFRKEKAVKKFGSSEVKNKKRSQ
jgi:hypothetical protein